MHRAPSHPPPARRPTSKASGISRPLAAPGPDRQAGSASTLHCAERLGHRWPPLSAAGTVPGAPLLQRATLSVETTGMDDYETIHGEAELFHANQGQGVFYDVPNDAVSGTTDDETHLDAFGHGNSTTIGDYSPETFAELIASNREKLGLAAVNTVTLHSCEAATPLDLTDEEEGIREKYKAVEGKSFVERLHDVLFNQYFSYVEVSGYSGETYTDRLGRTRLLKAGKADKDYRREMDDAKREDVVRGGTTLQDAVALEYFEAVGTGRETRGPETAEGFGLTAYAKLPPGLPERFTAEVQNKNSVTEEEIWTILNAILKDRWEERAEPGELAAQEGDVLSGGALLSGQTVEDRNLSGEDQALVGSKLGGAHSLRGEGHR